MARAARVLTVRYQTETRPDQLHFVEEGAGPAALLIHGFGESVYSWRYLIPDLAKRNRVYAIDLKGHGQSPKPRDGAYSPADQAELLLRFLDEHGIESPVLVGHSMGGGIALLLALSLQGRGTPASRLVLIDSIAYPQPLPFFIKLLRVPVVAEILTRLVPVRWQVRIVLKIAYRDDAKISSEAVDAYSAPLQMQGGRFASIATARMLIPDDLDAIVSQYPDLQLPTLIIWGRNDEITPLRVGEQLNTAIPGSTLRVLENEGHVPHEENPAKVNQMILEFVR